MTQKGHRLNVGNLEIPEKKIINKNTLKISQTMILFVKFNKRSVIEKKGIEKKVINPEL